MAIKLSETKESLNLDLTSDETKVLNKVKKWSNIVFMADQMIVKKIKCTDIDTFSTLRTHIDVCKSLLEIEVVNSLKTELDKINDFQKQVSDMFDAEPQDRKAIKEFVDKQKEEIKINYDVEFDAIYN